MAGLPGCANFQTKSEVAVIKTSLGDMTVEFYPQVAPKAVENFITHSKNKYYDGLIFHRVIKDFMIQGGDPTGTGMGGESIWGGTFEYEISDQVSHDYGALAMAHSSLPDSNGSQFYIVSNKEGAHYLDGDYTVFGRVVDGFEVLDNISVQPTDDQDRPVTDVIIKTIEIIKKVEHSK
ncbi:MAG: peptidylprolyl isomerase [Oscillospiraceae bacterium]|nr:peptidylprolyl isomerase [Oscillospiraceae bacterium]